MIKRLIIFILVLLFFGNFAIATVFISKDLLNSSLSLSQEKWTDKCVSERLPRACKVLNCSKEEAIAARYEISKACWNQYNMARKSAYLNKARSKLIMENKPPQKPVISKEQILAQQKKELEERLARLKEEEDERSKVQIQKDRMMLPIDKAHNLYEIDSNSIAKKIYDKNINDWTDQHNTNYIDEYEVIELQTRWFNNDGSYDLLTYDFDCSGKRARIAGIYSFSQSDDMIYKNIKKYDYQNIKSNTVAGQIYNYMCTRKGKKDYKTLMKSKNETK